AFPGAEGPGSTATGGRGGDVYHVTNLNFDKDGVTPGSLKYGINTAPAAGRTIVFDVGGTIFHDGGGSNWWVRSGKSNLTIAAQTAPGGVTIAGVGSKFTGDNLVVRNLAVRPNQDPINPTSFTYDGLATQATNSIFDHMSVTWFTDEGISATDAVNNTTIQYALIGEGLNYNGHSYGSIINTQNNDAPLSYHHNLYAHNSSRNPRLGSETGTGAIANFSNNVIYNWSSRAGYSALNTDTGAQEPSRTNFLNNFYARGANRGSTIFSSAGDATQIYQSGNLYDGVQDGDFDDAVAVTWANFSGVETQASTPFPVEAGFVESATAARDRVLDYAGANWWNRTSTDARIVASVRTGDGRIINSVPAEEWDDLLAAPLVSRDADWDVDRDGMPDAWEIRHGLDPLVDDHNGDFDADGYLNLEEYLNELAAWPAPKPLEFNPSQSNRFAESGNWELAWQPSRFDQARIVSGDAIVDAVGQSVGAIDIAPDTGQTARLVVSQGALEVVGEIRIAESGADGRLVLSGGALRTGALTNGHGGSFEFTGGTLSADIVAFDLTNAGGVLSPGDHVGVAPGARIGATMVTGDLTLQAGS
ncbi:MAG: hypothetical protein KDA61_19355, partial [Planctomycetales bacterium]|nr:hypothetical protein [Planctomycetales bacterium]